MYEKKQQIHRYIFAVLGVVLLAGCSSDTSVNGGSLNNDNCSFTPAAELLVTDTNPGNGAQSVSLSPSVSITFNTCLNPSTVNSGSVVVSNTSVGSTLTYDSATASLNLQFDSNLSYSTTYYVTVSNLLMGHAGESMASPYFFNFRTRSAPETTAPTTTASYAAGIYNAPIDVVLTCDDGIGSGCANIFYTLDGSTPSDTSSVYASPVTIATSSTLRFYAVDNDGNVEAVQSLGYIIDSVAPTVSLVTPADASTGVPMTSAITVVFSEAIDPLTVIPANFTIDNGVTGTLSYDDVLHKLTFVPDDRLLCNTPHHLTIGTGFKDVAGNSIVAPVNSMFTTHSDCVEPTTTVDIPRGVFTAPQSVSLSCTDASGSGCARIIYTTDGSVPSTVNGTIVASSNVFNIAIPLGDTLLRFYAEDAAGNREVMREHQYTVSNSGFTLASTSAGLYRGAGKTPSSFVKLGSEGRTDNYFKDSTNNRHYRLTSAGIYVSDDGSQWVKLNSLSAKRIYAKGSYVFASTYSGLYKSIDGGANFTFVDFPLYAQDSNYDVIGEGNNVYLATDGGLGVSTDMGKTFVFRTTADGLPSDSLRDLELSAGKLYMATTVGISITADGGASFSNAGVAEGIATDIVNSVAVAGTQVYAATSLGLSISTDGGASFPATRVIANGLSDNYVNAVYTVGGNVYTSMGNPSQGHSFASFCYSVDGALNFSCNRVNNFMVSDPMVNTIYDIGGTLFIGAYPTLYSTTDNGLNKTQVGPSTNFLDRILVDGSTFYVIVKDSSGTGGIMKSSDYGQTFTFIGEQQGLGDNTVSDIYVDGATLYVATANGISVSTDGGSSFTTYTGGPYGANGLNSLSVSQVVASGSNVYAVSGTSYDVSIDGGNSFTSKITGLGIATELMVSASNVYIPTSGGFEISTDGGTTFASYTTLNGLGSDNILDAAINGSRIYAATSSGLFYSDDGGNTFAMTSGYSGTSWVYAVNIVATEIFAATAYDILYSNDNGLTFTTMNIFTPYDYASVSDVTYVP